MKTRVNLSDWRRGIDRSLVFWPSRVMGRFYRTSAGRRSAFTIKTMTSGRKDGRLRGRDVEASHGGSSASSRNST